MSRTLENKVALITGAGQGIGQGIAFSLASRGVRVIAVGRTLDKCERTAQEIKRRFDQDAAALQCDISDLSALDELVTEACTPCLWPSRYSRQQRGIDDGKAPTER